MYFLLIIATHTHTHTRMVVMTTVRSLRLAAY